MEKTKTKTRGGGRFPEPGSTGPEPKCVPCAKSDFKDWAGNEACRPCRGDEDTVTLVRKDWIVPERVAVDGPAAEVVPFWAGRTLRWSVLS